MNIFRSIYGTFQNIYRAVVITPAETKSDISNSKQTILLTKTFLKLNFY